MSATITHFLTKIICHDNGICELLLPNGDCVARGSSSHCWNERDHWEEVLKMEQQTPPKKGPKRCMKCERYILSTTLGSMEVPIWHCQYGLTPSTSCQEEGECIDRCKKRQAPKQLELF